MARNNIDCSQWDKSPADLLRELKHKDCSLEIDPETALPLRVVNPVFVRLRWKNIETVDALTLTEDKSVMKKVPVGEKNKRPKDGIMDFGDDEILFVPDRSSKLEVELKNSGLTDSAGSYATCTSTPLGLDSGKNPCYCVLVNTKDVLLHKNGQDKKKNSLMAEKAVDGENPMKCTMRGFVEELHISMEEQEAYFDFRNELERDQTNKMQSRSYNGLMAIYEKKQVCVDIKPNAPREFLEKLGLFDGGTRLEPFTSAEKTELKDTIHHWSWMPEDRAYECITGANFDVEF